MTEKLRVASCDATHNENWKLAVNLQNSHHKLNWVNDEVVVSNITPNYLMRHSEWSEWNSTTNNWVHGEICESLNSLTISHPLTSKQERKLFYQLNLNSFDDNWDIAVTLYVNAALNQITPIKAFRVWKRGFRLNSRDGETMRTSHFPGYQVEVSLHE